MTHQNTLKTHRQYLVWYAFILINVLEFFLFKYYVARNVAPFYPASFDQASILALSYRIYENIKTEGLFSGILHSEVLPTGIFFPIQGAISFFFLGASRFHALLPNFLYFILLQLFSFLALRSLSAKNYLTLLFLGLLLCINTPFLEAGDITDFRMDFIAFCMYGIFICTVIKGQIFLNRTWAFITGFTACLCVLLRCITVVYLTGTLGLFFIYLLYDLYKKSRGSLEYTLTKKRLFNLILTGLTLAITILPNLWFNRVALYNYYVGNHVIGDEKNIRAVEEGVTTVLLRLSYYPKSLFETHIGSLGLKAGGLILLVYAFLYCRAKRTHQTPPGELWKNGAIFLFISFFIPLIILTADTIKSSVVGSILVMPFLFLLFWPCLYVDSKLVMTKNIRTVLQWLAVLILTAGLYKQFHELKHFPSKTKVKNGNAITKMYQDIGDYAVAKHWPMIQLSVDQICDYLTSRGIAIIYYETHNKYIEVGIHRLGSSIFAIDKNAALSSLAESNVFIFNLNPYPQGSPYPFNQTVNALRPLLFATAERRFKCLGDYQFMNSTYRVYVAA